MAKQNVALIAGVTGIVGEALARLLSKPDTAGGPWKVYGIARSPRPEWLPPDLVYVQCDLLDTEATLAKLSPLTDVTHLFWLTWISRPTEAENIRDNSKMLRNTIDALLPNAPDLKHIGLQTGGKHYLGSYEAIRNGKVTKPHPNPYTEDLPRLPVPNFYYPLEDIVFETAKQKQGKLTWTVHRPGIIFGLAHVTAMNLLGTLAVYGAICKHEGLPFTYPGNRVTWEGLANASNSDLIAEQEVWAATDPRGQNEAFNTVNGDVFKWGNFWKVLSEKLGLEFVPFTEDGKPLAESMKDKGPVWDKIVKEHGLVPSKLEQVGQWWFSDINLFAPASNILYSTNKSKEHGFLNFRNTEKSFISFIDEMRTWKLLPK